MIVPPSPSKNEVAFTLTELLIAISIVGLLSVLLLPAVNRVLANADRSGCASNLHQIGTALQLYLNDNENTYPGPLSGGQGYVFGTGASDQLVFYLAPYLMQQNLERTHSEYVMRCPAWHRRFSDPSKTGRCYAVNLSANLTNGKTGSPFGYPARGVSLGAAPLRTFSIASLTKTFALVDLDQEYVSGYRGNPLAPSEAIHQGRRNALYLDGHVEAVVDPNNPTATTLP